MGGRSGDYHGKTRTIIGGMEKITYEEKVNGVTVIRTRWREKKKKVRIR